MTLPTPTFAAPITSETREAKARRLLHSAGSAAEKLESDVRELVAMRAWDVLGYENFSEMWEGENGFKCPASVKNTAAYALMDEGMRTAGDSRRRDRPEHLHTVADVAKAVGYSTTRHNRGEASPVIRTLKSQKEHGVPAHLATTRGVDAPAVIAKYGTTAYSRARATPRRIGAEPHELVHEGFSVPKRDADEIAEIARKADLTKSEIYRQAVAEYLARYRASRPSANADERDV